MGDNYILKTGNNFNWLNSNISIINALSEENIPVAKIIKTINGLNYIIEDNYYFFLSKKIEGEHITDIYSEDYKELGYLIGQVIGRLHSAFRKCQEKISCHDNNFIPIMMTAIEMLFVAFFTNNNDEKNADEAETMLIWLWENRESIQANIP